jgi:3-hydroxybenzoate 6-monooxygenase
MVQFIAQGAGGDFERAFQHQAIRIVRASRVQISSWLMDKLMHAGGVERLVRNSIFAGRTPQESYDRLAWLYTAPEYVKAAKLSA